MSSQHDDKGKNKPEEPHGHPPVPIFINKTRYETTAENLTGKEIKALAGYGDDFDLFLLQGEGDKTGKPVADNEAVPVKPGLHFRALPRDRNFGDGVHPDLARLIDRIRELGHAVEVLVDGGAVGLVFPTFPLPEGLFNGSNTRLLLKASRDPNAALDMFWTSPELRLRLGSVPQAADAIEMHFGQAWRRFSWHWHSPWNPGRDNVLTYLAFVEERLARGV